MPEKSNIGKVRSNPSLHFTRKGLIDFPLSLVSDLSYLSYLQRHEPLSFAIAYERVRKAQKLTISAFKAIYKAYKLQRGAV
jgi:hypothetical protein